MPDKRFCFLKEIMKKMKSIKTITIQLNLEVNKTIIVLSLVSRTDEKNQLLDFHLKRIAQSIQIVPSLQSLTLEFGG